MDIDNIFSNNLHTFRHKTYLHADTREFLISVHVTQRTHSDWSLCLQPTDRTRNIKSNFFEDDWLCRRLLKTQNERNWLSDKLCLRRWHEINFFMTDWWPFQTLFAPIWLQFPIQLKTQVNDHTSITENCIDYQGFFFKKKTMSLALNLEVWKWLTVRQP